VAWGRQVNMQHLLLVITNAPKESSAEQELIIKNMMLEAPKQILGDRAQEARVNPAGLDLEYHDPRPTYAQNYEKLVVLRKRYDPDRRLKGLVRLEDL